MLELGGGVENLSWNCGFKQWFCMKSILGSHTSNIPTHINSEVVQWHEIVKTFDHPAGNEMVWGKWRRKNAHLWKGRPSVLATEQCSVLTWRRRKLDGGLIHSDLRPFTVSGWLSLSYHVLAVHPTGWCIILNCMQHLNDLLQKALCNP